MTKTNSTPIHRQFETRSTQGQSRWLALALSFVVTVSMLQSIDLLATREHQGTSLMSKAAHQVVAKVKAVKAADRA